MRFYHHLENREGRTKVILSLDEQNNSFNLKFYYNWRNTNNQKQNNQQQKRETEKEFGLNISGSIGNCKYVKRDGDEKNAKYYYLVPIVIFDAGNRIELVPDFKFDFELIVLEHSETLHIRDPIRDLISEDGSYFNNDDLTFSAILFNNLNVNDIISQFDNSLSLSLFSSNDLGNNGNNENTCKDKMNILYSVTKNLKLERV